MDETDPYFTVQEEVLKNISTLSSLYFSWCHPEAFCDPKKLINDIKQLTRSIEWDLEDIQVSRQIFPHKFANFLVY